MVQLLWVTVSKIIELLYDTLILLLGEVKTDVQTKTYTQIFIAALFIMVK